jgi:hypothetical protein
MSVRKTNIEIAKDALIVAGETLLLPGGSYLAKGEIKKGLAHVGLGLAARLALGAPGLILVGANAYCTAKTGESLLKKLTDSKGSGDFSLREEVADAIDKGGELDVIVEGIVEDVEDIYHEQTIAAAAQKNVDDGVEVDKAETVDSSQTETQAQAV